MQPTTGRPGFLDRLRGGGECPRRHCMADVARSALGSFVGICVAALPSAIAGLGSAATIGLIGSFGASAVLIYGLPRAELAQPRNVVGGHVVSAAVGVAVFMLLPGDPVLAAGFAVASAVAAMHLTRTLHPPGGATALIAVTGGPGVHQLGFTYVLTPVLAGTSVMLLVALVVNNLTHNARRNYPVYWW